MEAAPVRAQRDLSENDLPPRRKCASEQDSSPENRVGDVRIEEA
jgi:hypothetical protein